MLFGSHYEVCFSGCKNSSMQAALISLSLFLFFCSRLSFILLLFEILRQVYLVGSKLNRYIIKWFGYENTCENMTFQNKELVLAFCSPAPSTVFLLLMIVNLSLCQKDVWFIYWLLFLITSIKKLLCTDGTSAVSLLFLETKLETSPKYLVVNRAVRHKWIKNPVSFSCSLFYCFLKAWFHNWLHVLNKMNLHCPESKKTTFFCFNVISLTNNLYKKEEGKNPQPKP